MKDDETALAYIARVQQIVLDLRSTGVEIQDSNIAMTVLMALPEKFENMIVANDTLEEDDLIPDFVKSRLVQEKQCVSDRLENSYSIGFKSALMSRGRDGRFRANRYCNCGKEGGHVEQYYFRKRDDLAAQTTSTQNGQGLVIEQGRSESNSGINKAF